MKLALVILAIGVLVGGGILIFRFLIEGKIGEEKLPYRAKKYFFSRSEQEFFRVLNESIDQSRYVVFPKVRLADFVEVTARGREYWKWWNKIKSKHIDFLVWDIKEQKIALAIELDGKSHKSEKMQRRDEFVEKMYEKIGIRLERVYVGSDFLTEVKNLALH